MAQQPLQSLQPEHLLHTVDVAAADAAWQQRKASSLYAVKQLGLHWVFECCSARHDGTIAAVEESRPAAGLTQQCHVTVPHPRSAEVVVALTRLPICTMDEDSPDDTLTVPHGCDGHLAAAWGVVAAVCSSKRLFSRATANSSALGCSLSAILPAARVTQREGNRNTATSFGAVVICK